MSQVFDPRIDRLASERWACLPVARAPWLHEEVARRMGERLAFIRMPMQVWTNWSWRRGGQVPDVLRRARSSTGFWARWFLGRHSRHVAFLPPAPSSQDMIWSNMQLHMEAASQSMMTAWYEALKTDGFVMFSCLGPDTLKELRAVYASQTWPAPLHEMTDMHDWGDRLVALGFSQPVMDMERFVLTFATPQRALQELRELGRNLHPARARATRSRVWYAQLLAALEACRNAQGHIELTFELIYGHAIKPLPRVPVAASSVVSLARMREMLRQ